MSVGGHERFEACAAHVERAVAEEASEEWEGSGEYHLPESVDPVGEGLACLDEASRPCRSEKVSLGSYAEYVQAHREAYPSSEELVVEERVRAVREQAVFEGLVDPGRRGYDGCVTSAGTHSVAPLMLY